MRDEVFAQHGLALVRAFLIQELDNRNEGFRFEANDFPTEKRCDSIDPVRAQLIGLRGGFAVVAANRTPWS